MSHEAKAARKRAPEGALTEEDVPDPSPKRSRVEDSDDCPPSVAAMRESLRRLRLPVFLRKTWEIVNHPHYQDIVRWNADGDSLVVDKVRPSIAG